MTDLVQAQRMSLRVGVLVALATVLAAFALVGTRAEAAVSAGCDPDANAVTADDIVARSCFQAGNGALVPSQPAGAGIGTRVDWSTAGLLQRPIADDSGDSQYTGGKEQSPLDWTFSTGAGSVTPAKSDVVRAVLSNELVDMDSGAGFDPEFFLYMAFLNAGDSGNQNTNIEFNQLGTTMTANGVTFPRRSAGDVLITYDGKLGDIRVGMCRWVGNHEGQTAPGDTDGWYDLDDNGPLKGSEQCTELDASDAAGSTNEGTALANNGAIPSFPGAIGASTFGELAINLSAVLSTPTSPCISFGQVFMHSRTSDAVDSAKNDIVPPIAIPGFGTCGIAVEKQVSTDGASWEDADDAASALHTDATNDLQYRIAVTNTGTADVDVDTADIDDPGCGTISGPDETLVPGETAYWTCSKPASDGAFSPGGSYQNTATVSAHAGSFVVPDVSDDAWAAFNVHPSIDVEKTGPLTAEAGSAVEYAITVENDGDVEFAEGDVDVTDAQCAEAPALQGKGGDATPGTLDPGDVWSYTCSVLTQVGQTEVVNVADGDAIDPFGTPVGDSDTATTQLTQPPAPPVVSAQSRNPTGTAELVRQPAKCISKRFRYDVAGRDIKKATFAIDGKVEKVLTEPGANGRFSLHVNPLLRSDKRHRLTVTVEFTDASNTAPKTLSVFYKRCACLSRRAFPIRLRKQFGEDLKSAKVYVNGKRVQTIRSAKRLKAPVRLVGLPKGRFAVKITAVTVSGRKVSGTRRYRTCAKKLKGGIPKL